MGWVGWGWVGGAVGGVEQAPQEMSSTALGAAGEARGVHATGRKLCTPSEPCAIGTPSARPALPLGCAPAEGPATRLRASG